MGMFLQKVDNIKNKAVSSYQNFAAEVTKLGDLTVLNIRVGKAQWIMV